VYSPAVSAWPLDAINATHGLSLRDSFAQRPRELFIGVLANYDLLGGVMLMLKNVPNVARHQISKGRSLPIYRVARPLHCTGGGRRDLDAASDAFF